MKPPARRRTSKTSQFLRFGIPSLDDLFGTTSVSHRSAGIGLTRCDEGAKSAIEPTKICISGVEGSGKSILALHLASRYLADSFNAAHATRVLYISTDLTHGKALEVWRSFRLNWPNLREVPAYRASVSSKDGVKITPKEVTMEVALVRMEPSGGTSSGTPNDLAGLFAEPNESSQTPRVAFIDFANVPLGDAWGFANRLLALLPEPECEAPRHLVIIDTVDGFEALVGERDAFGEVTSRRARISQMIQHAHRKSHLMLVAEDGTGAALPENDVADVVIQMRCDEVEGYRTRTVEITKARAQATQRGQHYLLIRDGLGSSTGLQENPDDPRTTNAYVQVVPSLHLVSRRFMNEVLSGTQPKTLWGDNRAGFGLADLDEMLGGNNERESDRCGMRDTAGLEYGTLNGLIGDANTMKTQLAQRFLLRGFELYAKHIVTIYSELVRTGDLLEAPHTLALVVQLVERITNRDGDSTSSSTEDAKELPRWLLGLRQGAEANWTLEQLAGEIKDRKLCGTIFLLAAWYHDAWRRIVRKIISGVKSVGVLSGEPAEPAVDWSCARVLAGFSVRERERADREYSFVVGGRRPKPDRKDLLRIALKACMDCGIRARGYVDVLDVQKQVTIVRPIIERLLRPGETSRDDDPIRLAEQFSVRCPPAWKTNEELIRALISAAPQGSRLGSLHSRFQQVCPEHADLIGPEELNTDARHVSADLAERIKACLCLQAFDEEYEEAVASVDSLTNWLRNRTGPFAELHREEGARELAVQLGHACALLDVPKPVKAKPGRGDLNQLRARFLDLLKGDGDPMRGLWEILGLTEAHAGILGAKPLKREIKAFSEWLLNLSPKSHPYAVDGGLKALSDELGHRRAGPLLLSALVAATLQAIREGRLQLKSSKNVGEEVRLRAEACEDVSKFADWSEFVVQSETLQPVVRALQRAGRVGYLTALSRALSGAFRSFPAAQFAKTEFGRDERTVEFANCLLEVMARECLVDGPAVLITTGDVRIEHLCDEYRHLMDRLTTRQPLDEIEKGWLAKAALAHLREWLVCRRLEVHYMSAAVLGIILRQSVAAGQGILFRGGAISRYDGGVLRQEFEGYDRDNEKRISRSWNIRLVIDGLASMRKTYPVIADDPLFLPYLKFYIGRERVTGLVVITQSGRPDSTGVDQFERETVNLFLHQVRTWRVPFYGGHRIAVTALPPPPSVGLSRVRELKLINSGSHDYQELAVDRHFELYRGLEQGEPAAVGLEVRLASGTRARTRYIESLNTVFRDVFPGAIKDAETGQSRVVEASSKGGESLGFREFTRLHRDSRLEHTLIVEIDESWAFQRSEALRSQRPFLDAMCEGPDGPDPNDSLELYQHTMAYDDRSPRIRRRDRFLWNGHFRSELENEVSTIDARHVDRIPFMWDFGFLLCEREAWDSARDHHLDTLCASFGGSTTVGDVWKAMRVATAKGVVGPDRADEAAQGLRSWRRFLEASQITAATVSMHTDKPVRAFDLPVATGETLVCLVLEIWASEVYRKYRRKSPELLPGLFGRFTRRSWQASRTRGLIGLLAEPESRGGLKAVYREALSRGQLPSLVSHSLEFFKTFLLLREVLDLPSLVDPGLAFGLSPRGPAPNAVAARHWYRTACDRFEGPQDASSLVAVQLPGHFSVRGDWFLAVAAGSHSSVLADRALDLLSSRRANVERLQEGVGLPVRDVSQAGMARYLRTRLRTVDSEGRHDWIRYGALADLGADLEGCERTDDQGDLASFDSSQSGFFWLWRSTLGDYDAQARVFQKGVAWLIHWWKGLVNLRGTQWKSGFELYDKIELYLDSDPDSPERDQIFDECFGVRSLWEFAEICDSIIAALRKATPRRLPN